VSADRFEGRVPPHDLNAERAVLAATMLDQGSPADHRPSAFELVMDRLRPEHFYSEAHRRIFEAQVALHGEGKPLDSVGVASWLEARDRLPQVGGMAYVANILLSEGLPQQVRAYAQTLVDTALVRRTILAAQETAARGYVGYGDASDFVVKAAERFGALAQDTLQESTSEALKDILKARAKKLTAMAQSGQTISGFTTGLSRYDRLTAGLQPGDVTIVAARPGMGKTSLVAGWAECAATGNYDGGILPTGVALFSLEMPRAQIGDRIMCRHAGVDVSKLRVPATLSQLDWEKLFGAATALGRLPIWVDDQPGITLFELEAKLRWMRQECAKHFVTGPDGKPLLDKEGKTIPQSIGVVAVDYLQLMQGRQDRSREQEVSEISRGLKGIAKDMKVAVVALSQMNRKVEDRSSKRPQISDLRESGAIEQDADNIVFIWSDPEDESAKGTAELIVAKQRSGPTDTVRVRFDRHCTRFSDLPDGDYYDDPDRRTGG
jgi:replicative DNA helicase